MPDPSLPADNRVLAHIAALMTEVVIAGLAFRPLSTHGTRPLLGPGALIEFDNMGTDAEAFLGQTKSSYVVQADSTVDLWDPGDFQAFRDKNPIWRSTDSVAKPSNKVIWGRVFRDWVGPKPSADLLARGGVEVFYSSSHEALERFLPVEIRSTVSEKPVVSFQSRVVVGLSWKGTANIDGPVPGMLRQLLYRSRRHRSIPIAAAVFLLVCVSGLWTFISLFKLPRSGVGKG